MPRRRGFSISSSISSISSFFSHHGEDSDSDDNTAPNAAPNTISDTTPKHASKHVPFSTRVQARLKGLLPAKTQNAPARPRVLQVEPPTAQALYLATLKSLPPLSPTGRRYAIEMEQGNMTFAHFAGEEYFRWLQDGLPGYEEVVGDEKAARDRYLIEVHRRADYEELHDLFIPGNFWYASENWEPGEKNKASRSPFPICTRGVAVVKRQRSTTVTGERDSRTKVHKRATSSPEILLTREKSAYSVIYSGDKSPIPPKPSDTSVEMLQSLEDDSDEEEEVLMLRQKGHVELLESIESFRTRLKELEILDPYKG